MIDPMSSLVAPPAVRPGDLIAVVAPSSPVPEPGLWPGLAWLRDRYRLKATSRILARQGYLAGGDVDRRVELERALRDPEVRAVVAVRGGYGAMRVLEALDLPALLRRPVWVVGFSDLTVLHVLAWSLGMASIHGAHVSGLGDAPPFVRASWMAALERPHAQREWSGLTVLHPGEAVGPILGGNLTLLVSMAASGRLQIPPGAILALEDVTERPYRVDRMLTALRLGGYLERAAGIVFGGFDQCDAGPDGVEVADVLAERTKSLGVPVFAGAPFGHRAHNESFVLGLTARMAGDRVTLGG
jgi:muramoyltetrapeptide carboxypeptidase